MATLPPPQSLYGPAKAATPMARVSPFRQPELHDEASVLPEAAYTHGFESIYALENVDVSTVRPLKGAKPVEEPKPQVATLKVVEKPKPKAPVPEVLEDQLRLDFGAEYRGWMEPFRMNEPIEVLGLSPVALKGLHDNGRQCLRDLLDIDRSQAMKLKGLGQGHIDETIEKLEAYLEGYPRQRANQADFSGLVMSVVGTAEKKSAHLWLSKYKLEDLLPLTAADQAEIRHLNAAQRGELASNIASELAGERTGRFVKGCIQTLIEVFVKPWMRKRQGMASTRELYERLERVSRDAGRARSTLNYVMEVFYQGESPFKKNVTEVEPGIFVVDRYVALAYRRVLNCAKTYFYKDGISYSLAELESYIARECARKWEGFPEGFIVQVLRRSPSFRVRKAENGKLMVRRLWV
ncbi:MAG: hypothetical protein KDK78_02025 [Chlamydiia bacterium]|nr:hypothetical protein [Chlamydiia bacterium]